uniref:Mannose binding lectin 2 n=1 Tax=Pygocentrus nattereri TaxID=42514 RepID=A0AAR2KNR5_PYGNA
MHCDGRSQSQNKRKTLVDLPQNASPAHYTLSFPTVNRGWRCLVRSSLLCCCCSWSCIWLVDLRRQLLKLSAVLPLLGFQELPDTTAFRDETGETGETELLDPKERRESWVCGRSAELQRIREASENRGQQESDHCALISGLSVQGPPGKAGPAGPPGPQGPKGDAGSSDIQDRAIRSLQLEIKSLTAKISLLEKAASFPTSRKVGQKYYVTDGSTGNFDQALKLCSDIGGAIVLPRNEEQNQALVKLIAPFGSEAAYIGITDRQVEGQFVDTEGKSLTFTKWGTGQPDNYRGVQDCASILESTIWDDHGCEVTHLIVCEI